MRRPEGDIWSRLAKRRPLGPDTPPDRLRAMKSNVHRLMTVDAGPSGPLMTPDGPLSYVADWTRAVEDVRKALGEAAANGRLSRGIRDVLAHHIIFHWNRVGLSLVQQGILARTARDVVLGDTPP